MLSIEHIGFIINVINANDYKQFIEKVKNTLSIVLRSPVEFKERSQLYPTINVDSIGSSVSIIPTDDNRLQLLLLLSTNNIVKGAFISTFDENILTNTVYEFLQFLSELMKIQLTKIELNSALLKQRKNLDAILESLNIGILVVDSNLVTQKYNQNFLIMLDIDTEVENMSIQNYLQKATLAHFLELKEELDTKNFAFEKVFDFTFGSGRVVKYALSISTFNYEEIKNYIYVLRDLTYTKEIERLKSLDMQKNTFLAHITHELKTPLTAIMGYLELLVDQESDPQKKIFLKNIYSESENMLHLIQNLLTITKIELGSIKLNITQFDLIQVINKVIDLFRTSKIHNFKFHSSVQEVKIWGDKEKIREIFLNLISNAVKYSPKGGDITIEIIVDYHTNYINVAISDEGVGIPEELIPYIFEKFYRVENPLTATVQGTGLGLYIVKNLIELHQGKITVKSQKEHGTTFFVSLPLKKIVATTRLPIRNY